MAEPVVINAPFEAEPCQCVRNHVPRPTSVEMHHPWPPGNRGLSRGAVGYRVRRTAVETRCSARKLTTTAGEKRGDA